MATIHPLPNPSSRKLARPRARARAKAPPRPRKQPGMGAPAKAVLIGLGTLGLAAVAVALIGPRRLEREVFRPLQKAVGPQAGKLWDQAQPVRAQLTQLFRRAGGEREKLARDFQSWIGHFRAH